MLLGSEAGGRKAGSFAAGRGNEYMVEEVLDQWYGPQDTFQEQSAQMTAISTSCAGKRRRPMVLGIWFRSGNCRARVDLGS